MSEVKYRALREGKMTPQPGGPTVRVHEGEVLILTDEQFAANATLFVPVDAPKPEEPVKAEAVKPTPAVPKAPVAAEKPKAHAPQTHHRR